MESIPLQACQALGSPLFPDNSAREGGKVVSPIAPAAFTPQEGPSVLISVSG